MADITALEAAYTEADKVRFQAQASRWEVYQNPASTPEDKWHADEALKIKIREASTARIAFYSAALAQMGA